MTEGDRGQTPDFLLRQAHLRKHRYPSATQHSHSLGGLLRRRQTDSSLPCSVSNEGVILTHLAGQVACHLEDLPSEPERPPEGTRCRLAASNGTPYERDRQ